MKLQNVKSQYERLIFQIVVKVSSAWNSP